MELTQDEHARVRCGVQAHCALVLSGGALAGVRAAASRPAGDGIYTCVRRPRAGSITLPDRPIPRAATTAREQQLLNPERLAAAHGWPPR
jgi:hypothetical protein